MDKIGRAARKRTIDEQMVLQRLLNEYGNRREIRRQNSKKSDIQ